MHPAIPRILERFSLPTQAGYFLDSIAYQITESGRSQEIAQINVSYVAEIVSKYPENVRAAMMIDDAMGECLRQFKPNTIFGLKKLYDEEKKLANNGGVSLKGLKDRIDEHMRLDSSRYHSRSRPRRDSMRY